MSDYERMRAMHPALEGVVPGSVEWYETWQREHLVKYPACDATTRANLAGFVEDARARADA